jgi:hypothetical protein
VSWLVLPDVRSQIWGSREADDARQAQALAELENLGAELAELRELNRARKISLTAFAEREQSVLAAIDRENAVLKADPGVRIDIFGPDAADKWVTLKADSPDAARQFLADAAIIYVNQAASRGGVRHRAPDDDRYEWHWKIGENVTVPRQRNGATERLRERRAALDEARRKAEELLLGDPTPATAPGGTASATWWSPTRRRSPGRRSCGCRRRAPARRAASRSRAPGSTAAGRPATHR